MVNFCRSGSPVLVALAMAACSSTPAAPPAPRARGEAAGIRITASVESVDLATRRVPLNGSKRESETYIAGPEVKRLPEIKAGDKTPLDYRVVVIAELHAPTEEEKKAPLVMVEGADRAPSDMPPGAPDHPDDSDLRNLRQVRIEGNGKTKPSATS